MPFITRVPKASGCEGGEVEVPFRSPIHLSPSNDARACLPRTGRRRGPPTFIAGHPEELPKIADSGLPRMLSRGLHRAAPGLAGKDRMMPLHPLRRELVQQFMTAA
jgi:hypothetical protein